ncbi:scavenger receptor cysteine-rich domain-containing protein [Ditylenchus destructor]|nr:scavenger receptor cysteine-rich domain-containing protein [Ditylenchus destructor]
MSKRKFPLYSCLLLYPFLGALYIFLLYFPVTNGDRPYSGFGHPPEDIPLGQRVLPEGHEQPRQKIRTKLGGFYSQNVTLFFRNSPFRVESELIVESSATITIETGVQMYFDTGVGMKVFGTIRAIGNEFAHIQMLPYQEQLQYEGHNFPDFRLIDGPNVRQGRLQVRFRDRWRSMCTQVTNWTSIDTGVACRSMGYSDGGFWRFYQRNNDTYPFVMPAPKCLKTATNLWQCEGFSDPNRIPLTENLCQGEDDLGIYCWGPPTFTGWAKHWKGLQIYSSPFGFVQSDPDMVSSHKESRSRLEFIDIFYAGYDGLNKNTTAALYIEGVPPIMNGLRIEHSARDGIYFYEPLGPIVVANSTIGKNRGHGIAIENAVDGRFFLNQTMVEGNYGDGVWYRQRHAGMSMSQSFLGAGIGVATAPTNTRTKRQTTYYEKEQPRLDMCSEHKLENALFFPHLIKTHLQNGTMIDPLQPPNICWLTVSLPPRLPYSYTIQFINVENRNPPAFGSQTDFVVCDGNSTFGNVCQKERFRIPMRHGVLPQSVVVPNSEHPLYVGLEYGLGTAPTPFVFGDVDLLFKIHASVTHKAFYGLNITNSVIQNNTGNGVQAINVRDRTVLSNVSIESNQGLAGFLVRDGAADIWVNDTSLSYNWGDGMNVSYAGGAVNLNTSRIVGNRWRGFAYHLNDTIPFYALRHEILIKGRPANNIFYPKMLISGNLWGGALIGNICTSLTSGIQPKVLINWVEFGGNHYHPAIEVFSCQQPNVAKVHVDITGNQIIRGTAMGFRMEPCVNAYLDISSNRFTTIQNTAVLVRNAKHPWLKNFPAKVTIAKNEIKNNTGQYIVSIGLNEDAPNQFLTFNQQNELRGNTVINPFPFLKPRSTPYAALVVSSSNVKIHQNCFGNPRADFEIGTELMEHAKRIDARENNWGHNRVENFMHRIFDQFNRFSLASIDINPYAAVCNQRQPTLTYMQQYYRQFRPASTPNMIGGAIYENNDLQSGRYIVTDDLHVTPGAKLTLAAGTTLEFMNGVGMLVQGELLRDYSNPIPIPIVFTSRPFIQPQLDNIRLIDEYGDEQVTAGRLEVKLADGEWGTVCNRSWTPSLAQLACNQLGLIMDPQYFENWRIFPPPGDLPIRMDNIRCEEREWDLTKCRHDGLLHNAGSVLNCRPTEVVGIRCSPPYWAGVRYSLLASPPTMTSQTTMNHWTIEKAGLYDFRTSTFSPALGIDWNYHTFNDLTIRDNYFDGLDIVYNDLTKKPAIRKSYFGKNRRNGVTLRSVGLTMEKITVEGNENAGVRYNPRIEAPIQRDIVSWLDRREQPELEANNVYIIPNKTIFKLEVYESQLNHRKFLVAKPNSYCPEVLYDPCIYDLELIANGHEYGMPPKLAIQIVNRAHNESDEDAIFIDKQTGRRWSARQNVIEFPIVSSGQKFGMQYRRSYGPTSLIILVLFLDAQEYLDRFVHVYDSTIRGNQYGVSAVHYSNLTFVDDGAVLNRWSEEKLWFQKCNFTENKEAVLWIHSPQHAISQGTPIAQIGWHIDNCSIHHNHGPLVDTHRDLFSSANVFHFNFWSNTFSNNTDSGINVQLPDTYDLLARKEHRFLMTENRFEHNDNFFVQLSGYYAFANISSNNFTDNYAKHSAGILELLGMEKFLVMERNRFFNNWGAYMFRMETLSQSLRSEDREIPAFIQYNYFQFNHFLKKIDDYVDMWPRSFAVGIFGVQKAEVHYNKFRNIPQLPATDIMNVTHNWWGVANEAEVSQRIFDLDDWNIYTVAEFSPYYTTEELFINFWWHPKKGQLSYANYTEPGALDLKGRMYVSKSLSLDPERWYPFPYHYRPFRPYRITRDLTIMPGATLTIERNVEIHIWPNVRILVLGDLIADGTLWQPISFKPINATEYAQTLGRIGTRYKRSAKLGSLSSKLDAKDETMGRNAKKYWKRYRRRDKRHNVDSRFLSYIRQKRRAGHDDVFRQFPEVRRENPALQGFDSHLTENGTFAGRSGFLEYYNATSGEYAASCDRFFTVRNAQVVCRELGYATQNVYHWLTARWDFNPKLKIIKTYVEPRECRGNEPRLDKCQLRLSGTLINWQCLDSEHYNYIHCGFNESLSREYIGNWGGITFAAPTLEHLKDMEGQGDNSMLRHVEIVGGGHAHNDSLQSGALQVIRRSPILENVNVTNSSMHGIQVVGPTNNIVLSRLNVSDCRGLGICFTSTNLQSASMNSATPQGPLSLPYQLPGLLDMCASGKTVHIKARILMYYKYDSYAVDCVKVFRSVTGRNLGFRFLQVNLYGATIGLGRSDALSIYSGSSFSSVSLLRRFTAESSFDRNEGVVATQSPILGLHLRGTAADGEYGFLAEIATIPSGPIGKNVEEIAIRNSRLLGNDRGAMLYRNVGEIGPNVIMEQCMVEHNGYFLYGNISTSAQAVEFHLHNTLQVTLLNNLFCLNYALYFDTVLVQGMSTNFTRNLFCNNVGLHTIDNAGYGTDVQGNARISSDSQVFHYNFFENNLALGHGNPYQEAYGYQQRRFDELDEFKTRRPKRQVLNQKGVSFDWWTHVDTETGRYRSTILAGSAHQKYSHNVFNNPLNSYELTTSEQTQFDTGSIDARENYWGYPGTPGVAAGKIRDQSDFPYLIRVDHLPVLESNTSLIEGDCPAGWFQVGNEEFKSCFLFVGASMTYADAVSMCQEISAFVPILRNDDVRQKAIAARVDEFGQKYITDIERYNSFGMSFDIPFWISSVTLPSNQCGWMSSRTAAIGEQNCNNLLPFVCEKGTKPYQEPIMWRRDIILAVGFFLILAILLVILALCWCRKAHKRRETFHRKKQFVRDSLRKSKQRQFEDSIIGTKHQDSVAPQQNGSSMPAPGFPAMNPRHVGSESRSTSSMTNSDQTTSYGSTSYCTDKSRSCATDSMNNTGSRKSAQTVRRMGEKLGTDMDWKRTPPAPMHTPVSMNPNPYTETATFRKPESAFYGVQPSVDLSSSFCTTSTETGNCSCNGTARSCSTCCSSCQADSSLSSSMDHPSTIAEESERSSQVSGSSDSTVTAGSASGRPLLSTANLKTLGVSRAPSSSTLMQTPNSTARNRDQGNISAMSTLRASSRPDISQRSLQSHADFFHGSGRPLLSPTRSNPNLYPQASSSGLPFPPQTQAQATPQGMKPFNVPVVPPLPISRLHDEPKSPNASYRRRPHSGFAPGFGTDARFEQKPMPKIPQEIPARERRKSGDPIDICSKSSIYENLYGISQRNGKSPAIQPISRPSHPPPIMPAHSIPMRRPSLSASYREMEEDIIPLETAM